MDKKVIVSLTVLLIVAGFIFFISLVVTNTHKKPIYKEEKQFTTERETEDRYKISPFEIKSQPLKDR